MSANAADERDEQATPPQREIEQITPEGTPRFYANNVVLRMSLWDFTLDLGVILEANEAKLSFRDVATVVMSPQHAKVLADVLTKNVAEYERTFGRIPSGGRSRRGKSTEQEAG